MTTPATDSSPSAPQILNIRRPIFWLVAVALAYFIVQMTLFDVHRFLEWDEAVYVGNASSWFATPHMSAHRAPGAIWLARPVFWFTHSLVSLRIFLAAVSSVALAAGFGRWLKPCGPLAPIGMALFVFGWLPLAYGSELSPNLYVGACGVGAVGALGAYVSSRSGRDLLWVGVAVGVATLFRPSDAAVLSLGVVLGAFLVVSAADAWRLFLATFLGAAVGIVPWTIEAFHDFGGPIQRLQTASEIVDVGASLNVLPLLRLLDGPLMGPDSQPSVSRVVVLALALFATFAVVAIVSRVYHPMPALAIGVGLLMALPYALFVGVLAPRFLMPTLALSSVTVGAGLMRTVTAHPLVGVSAAVIVVCVAGWSMVTADRIEAEQTASRQTVLDASGAISDFVDGRDCLVIAQYASPQFMIATGCDATRALGDVLRYQIEARPTSDVVVVAVISDLPSDVVDIVSPIQDVGEVAGGWTLWTVEGQPIPTRHQPTPTPHG